MKFVLKICWLEIGVEEFLYVFIDRINVVNGSINVVVVNCFLEVLVEVREVDEEFYKMI